MKRLQSFKPFVHATSRVLILGSMPGPEALRKQQYYGFDGNHFWHILPKLFGVPRPERYEDRLQLARDNGVALWDVLESCTRPSALDSDIRDFRPNNIPDLLKAHPNIRAIFINGKFAHRTFLKTFDGRLDRPVFCLPSTSPANAAMSLAEKARKWSAILTFLKKEVQ